MKDERFYVIHRLECIERIEQYTVGGREGMMTALAQTRLSLAVRLAMYGLASFRRSIVIR